MSDGRKRVDKKYCTSPLRAITKTILLTSKGDSIFSTKKYYSCSATYERTYSTDAFVIDQTGTMCDPQELDLFLKDTSTVKILQNL